MSELKELVSLGQQNAKDINALTKGMTTFFDKMSKTPQYGNSGPDGVFGAPWARKGEDSMSSRGFSFAKMMGLMSGVIQPDNAKVEVDISNRLCKAMDAGTSAGYAWGGTANRLGYQFLAPLATGYLPSDAVDGNFRHEMKSLVAAGCDGSYDIQDETSWIKRKMLAQQGYGTKALSWLNELTGGALVAPPEMGELIELLRNKEALVNAGARVVPLPPQGRLKYPRQTSASTTYWVGENSPITESLVGTGEVTLQAKKLAVLIKAPNELIRFASPAAEALLRDDMTKSLALGLDLAGLEGNGTDTRPRGVVNFQNINRVNSSLPTPVSTSAGDGLAPQDIYRMIAVIEESNAVFKGWIMRPKTLYKWYQLRADAVAQGDKQGIFMFNLIREAGDKIAPQLGGYPVVTSTQVSQVVSRTVGNVTSNNLTYIVGGMWDDLLIGMFGAIEFAATTMGDTSFVNDQTWIRGILSADIQARHEAAFCVMSNLDTQI